MHYIVNLTQSIGVEAENEDEAREKAMEMVAEDSEILNPTNMSVEVSWESDPAPVIMWIWKNPDEGR